MISIVLPVYNEELILKKNTLQVYEYCLANFNQSWQIIISDNGSTDKTKQLAQELASQYGQIKYFKTHRKGKGAGVIDAWLNFPSQIYIFMDADLSTDLKDLSNLVRTINDGYDMCVGSRYLKKSRAKRTLFRKFFSLSLRRVLKLLFKLPVKDAACGFKAVNQQIVEKLIPEIENKTWFFDTEMLILAHQHNFNIKEIPVIWTDKLDNRRKSKVNTLAVIMDYLKNVYRLYKKTKNIKIYVR